MPEVFFLFFSFFFFFRFQRWGKNCVWVAWGKIKFTCFDGAMIPQNGNLIYECENFLSHFYFAVYLIHKQQSKYAVLQTTLERSFKYCCLKIASAESGVKVNYLIFLRLSPCLLCCWTKNFHHEFAGEGSENKNVFWCGKSFHIFSFFSRATVNFPQCLNLVRAEQTTSRGRKKCFAFFFIMMINFLLAHFITERDWWWHGNLHPFAQPCCLE